jgi:hypothetical protein
LLLKKENQKKDQYNGLFQKFQKNLENLKNIKKTVVGGVGEKLILIIFACNHNRGLIGLFKKDGQNVFF